MIRELATLGNGAVMDTDVCVVGAGAAGITLALALADRGIDVTVLESGGLEPEAPVQALYEADNVGIDYSPAQSRLRQFGGTTGHWAGFCRPFLAVDLQTRPGVPGSGWPLDSAELAAYLPGAHELLQLGPPDYRTDAWLGEIVDQPGGSLHGRGDEIVTEVIQFSPPTRFAATYRQLLSTRRRIDVLLHANAVAMETDEGGQVMRSLTVQGLDGTEVRVGARRFVLACGGIENARLLLSLTNLGRGGLGNDHDNVGRYFADHIALADAATLVVTGSGLGLYPGQHITTAPRSSVSGAEADPTAVEVGFRLRPSDRRLDQLGILGLSISLSSRRDAERDAALSMVRAFADRIDHDRGRPGGDGPDALAVRTSIATAPNRSSRVTLGDDLDALGLPRARLDFRLTELDRRTLVDGTTDVMRSLGALGVARGRVKAVDSVAALAEDPGRGVGNHHIGTTRMSDRPAAGVVDRHCRVHGSSNLFVAGSSVFTTAGTSTPTLNLVALALRLADRLAGSPYRS